MKDQIQMVKDFQLAFGGLVNEEPTNVDFKRSHLRRDLLFEEAGELEHAMKTGDLVEAADAITDCLYILFGTAHELGLADKLVDCFAEVHRSNMSKLDENGHPIFREDGKVLKSELYEKPNLFRIVFPEDYIRAQAIERLDNEIDLAMEEAKGLVVPAHIDCPDMYCKGKGIDVVVK